MKLHPFYLIHIIVIAVFFLGKPLFAQEVLDKAHYKFQYEFSYHFDTLNKNDVRNDLIILQVGQNVSKSYSYYTFRSDSLRATPDGDKVFRESFLKVTREQVSRGERPIPPFGRRMKTMVYKNYPQGKMTVTDAIGTNYYKYSDELHSQSWQIYDSTKTILNYTCQMAVSDFRGRRWIAWFAHDIPISDGPWKFSGLPGLIMEVYDSEKHFRFTLVGLEQVEDEPIVFSPVVLSYQSYGKHKETTRIDFLRGLARFQGNMISIMNIELGKETFDESRSNVRHNDLMERDYRR
ncbi:MAG: GLPGLI family protein [Bacteroidales bacterium]|nr:GLPGLI family protein [Bacteroidales bacterium]